MAAISKVGICNDALGHIGVKDRLQSDADDGVTAVQTVAAYDAALKEMLERRRWTFAERRSALSEAAGVDVPTGWTYAYLAPSDMLQPHGFWSGDVLVSPDLDPIYEMGWPGTGLPVFYTNTLDPELIYTANVTAPALFPAQFAAALAWRIAERIAPALAESQAWWSLAARNAELAESRAWAADLNGRRHPGVAPLPRSFRAR